MIIWWFRKVPKAAPLMYISSVVDVAHDIGTTSDRASYEPRDLALLTAKRMHVHVSDTMLRQRGRG